MADDFTKIGLQIATLESDVKERAQFASVPPFPAPEMTDNKRLARVVRAEKNFWNFDSLYFTEDMYSDGFSRPCSFHKDVATYCLKPGVHVIAGARKHAKTATAKKVLVWLLLTGRIKLAGTLSQTLPNSRGILSDVARLTTDNRRIRNDFNIQIITDNDDEFSYRVAGSSGIRILKAYSEGRSVKSAQVELSRPQFILCDDLENRQSPLSSEQVRSRISIISEAKQSLTDSGTLIVLANNFDERCAVNMLLDRQAKNCLPSDWHVYVYPVWHKGKPLWRERYPAKSETELKELLKPIDEAEWQGDFMQNPVPPDGWIFRRPHYEYDKLPADCRGVIYCDPNLSKFGRGDATSITPLMYSAQEDAFYVGWAICRSFSDSNDLLNEILRLKNERIYCVGFDGNVTQESTWTNNVRNWCRINKAPFPRIEYRRYRVDDLSKNIQGAWNEGKIRFPAGFAATGDGKRYLTQLFAFAGKKANRPDDAPDGLICAFELAHERGIVRRASISDFKATTINDHYF